MESIVLKHRFLNPRPYLLFHHTKMHLRGLSASSYTPLLQQGFAAMTNGKLGFYELNRTRFCLGHVLASFRVRPDIFLVISTFLANRLEVGTQFVKKCKCVPRIEAQSRNAKLLTLEEWGPNNGVLCYIAKLLCLILFTKLNKIPF